MVAAASAARPGLQWKQEVLNRAAAKFNQAQ